jgi:hypothetical protein
MRVGIAISVVVLVVVGAVGQTTNCQSTLNGITCTTSEPPPTTGQSIQQGVQIWQQMRQQQQPLTQEQAQEQAVARAWAKEKHWEKKWCKKNPGESWWYSSPWLGRIEGTCPAAKNKQ